MKKDYTVILLVVDRSGSMATIRKEAETALNEMVKAQKELPGTLGIKLVAFDNEIDSRPLVNANEFDYFKLSPRGLTALHDAMGKGITELDSELAALTEDGRPDKVLVVTITDGIENCSQEYTGSVIKDLITKQKKDHNWEFIFLAAGQDAVTTASNLGIDRGRSMTFAASDKGVTESVIATTRYMTDYRSGLETTGFTDEDRFKSMG
jgi:uncharacterized protein YegL